MKIIELKNEIKNYDKNELEKLVVEFYKIIPKSKREEYQLDEFIKNVNSNVKKKENTIEDFSNLVNEIDEFISNVDNGYYHSPNRVILKPERSKWRFKAKKYYKELNKILPNSENGELATSLLIELYKRLSEGTTYLIFNNWNTFGSFGENQYEYYEKLIKRIFASGYTEEKITTCIDLLLLPNDGNTLRSELFDLLTYEITSTQYVDLTIELLKKKYNELCSKKVKSNSSSDYLNDNNIDDIVRTISRLYMQSNEIDIGIKYFYDNYGCFNKSYKMYELFELLDLIDLKDIWIREYERNIYKLDYSDELKEKYKEYKEGK